MDSFLLIEDALRLPAWERAQIIHTLCPGLDPAEQTSNSETATAFLRREYRKGWSLA